MSNTGMRSDSEDGVRDLADYVGVLRRRKLIVLLVALITGATTLAMSLVQSERFEAKAEVLVRQQDSSAAVAGVEGTVSGDPERVARTQAQLARSTSVAQRVLDANPAAGVSTSDFLAHSSVTPVPSTDLLAFRADANTADGAVSVTNSYADEFVTYSQEVDTAVLKAAQQSLLKQVQTLRREGLTNSAQYADLVSRLDLVNTRLALPRDRVVVVRPAETASMTAPRTVRNVALGVLFGLIVGVGLAFLREALDTRLRTGAEASSLLGVVTLGRIPRARSRRGASLYPRDQSESVIEAEAYRMLRANLQIANGELDARTILVVSAIAGEGKSTTVANLAAALARAGKTVALVDLDLRNPSIAAIFGLSPKKGVAEVLRREREVADSLVEINVDLRPVGDGTKARPRRRSPSSPTSSIVHLLPAGPSLPTNPGELVTRDNVQWMLSYMRRNYDIVLVDAPPMLVVGDATVISSFVDALLVVVRPDVLHRNELEDLKEALDALPVPVLGVVTVAGDSSIHDTYYGRTPPIPPVQEAKARRSSTFRRERASKPQASARTQPAPREQTVVAKNQTAAKTSGPVVTPTEDEASEVE